MEPKFSVTYRIVPPLMPALMHEFEEKGYLQAAKEETKEDAKPEIEEIPSSEEQAEFNLPEETGQRRYLIDEDNPFKLEP